ncbi:peptidylprolyl isomerase [Mangrovimonas spongiae]|uniref:Peptidylprolyl isomerase n=1 Tax=Mangrovimonas spongiae TaxID=2494697 RepID=A0A3R9N5C4_9FLAO|nr:peptidylprolyl isomerase [Mangrovimonas spongiae]RSK39356.1 peptidylprolyl isomerase [Mangrovimonas spongiae]
MLRIYFFLAICFCSSVLQAQTSQNDILFTVDDSPVYSEEFIRVFKKNLDLVKDESQKDVDEYLKLFIDYKLKLKEAQALGLDEKTSYQRELEGYKKQLAKNYLTNNQVTTELVEEAYERVTNEIKASHILIKLNPNPKPEDTLFAYNELIKLRERVLNEGFESVKNDVHNGKTIFAEDLGYFSGFKMVYNFENAAYNTPVGDISMPFKTRFGYHIVKVDDKRASRGERTVAHIMISNNKENTTQENAETRINAIYQKLQQGEDFEALAKQFSNDISSAKKGGLLPAFEGGQLSSQEFEDVAFSLQKEGEVSKPFQTQFGWHIVKLYKISPMGSFNDMKSQLEAKVKRDSRSQLINEALVNKLKQDYKISTNNDALDYFKSILNEDYFKRTWQLPEDFKSEENLVKIGDLQLKYSDFGNYLVKTQRRQSGKKPINVLVEEQYKVFLGNHLIEYREAHLEDVNEEYANIITEYRDGLLLFDLMETEIWNAAKEDTLGLKAFYEKNKENYFWNTRIDAVVASSAKKSVIKKVSKMLANGETTESIKSKINQDNKVNVIFTSGVLEKNHQSLPEDFNFKKGVSKIYHKNDAFLVVNVKDVLPKTLKEFNEIEGLVLTDFQNYKEQEFVKQLHEKYTVVVNEAVLSKVKSQINQ